jgi:hypothetical protein
LVLAARLAGRIDAARSVLERLRDAGMFLSDAVHRRIDLLGGEFQSKL